MNQLAAFKETLELAEPFAAFMKEPNELSYDHLVDMFARIDLAEKAGTPFSESKKGRWLGWAQAAVVRTGFVSLEDMKNINVKHSKDEPRVTLTPQEFKQELSKFPVVGTLANIRARNYIIESMLSVMDELGFIDNRSPYTKKSNLKRLLEI